jgi:CubicO group peptidase (beta-lactamase class C family)
MKKTIMILCVCLALLIVGCLSDDKLKIDLNYIPTALDDGWEISTPAAEGFNESAFMEAYELFFSEDDYVTGLSLLVIMNGKLVAEGYCRDRDDINVKRNMQSATKSITSLVYGIARDQGYFSSHDQTLYEIIPEEFDSNITKRDITLQHLMTMRSGLAFDNDDFAEELHIEDRTNQLEYIIAKPLFADPGSQYWYRDCDPQLLGGAIYKQTGLTLEQIAAANLFAPLGITDYYWQENPDEQSWAAQALFMKPRDMAKIGKLVLNNGEWEGTQIISEAWIEESTSFQIEFDVPGEDLSGIVFPDFGFFWWIYDTDYSNLPQVEAFAAIGAGGQFIFVLPDENLIIVMTSEPYTDGEFSLQRDFYQLAEMIINSIEI